MHKYSLNIYKTLRFIWTRTCTWVHLKIICRQWRSNCKYVLYISMQCAWNRCDILFTPCKATIFFILFYILCWCSENRMFIIAWFCWTSGLSKSINRNILEININLLKFYVNIEAHCVLETHGRIPNSKLIVNMTLIKTYIYILYLMFSFQVSRTKSFVFGFLPTLSTYFALHRLLALIISTNFSFYLPLEIRHIFIFCLCSVHFDFVMITSFARCFIVSCKSFSLLNSTTF